MSKSRELSQYPTEGAKLTGGNTFTGTQTFNDPVAGEGLVNAQTAQTDIDLTDNFVIQKSDNSVRKIDYNNFLIDINLDNWFTILIKTDNVGTSTNTQFTIPTSGTGYNYTVLWDDGSSDTGVTGDITHTYATAGTYTVRIRGDFPTIYFNSGGDKDKLLKIERWGDIEWQSFANSFYGCSNLTSASSTSINTSNVTTMSRMFLNCTSLTTLDVSGFNTSNVTTMEFMFFSCSSLTTLDVSGFDTSQVTTMSQMFRDCNSLTTLDVSGWNTSNVTNMGIMFRGCNSLTTLDVSGWNTSNVTHMNRIFRDCNSLTTLDVSLWNTSNVTNMEFMFSNCPSLTTLDVSGFDTSNVTTMQYMFYICTSLTNFDPSGFTITNVTDLSFFATGTNMGTTNYDNLLVNWEAQLVNNSLSPNFGTAQYTAGSLAATARQALITDHLWSITDAGSV